MLMIDIVEGDYRVAESEDNESFNVTREHWVDTGIQPKEVCKHNHRK